MTQPSFGIDGFSFPVSDQVVCTLFEGDYFLGVATLINSIVLGGFRGLFWAGYKGSPPAWVEQLERRDDGLYVVGEALLGFEELPEARHFGQFKAEFMRSLFDRGIASRHLWYFDPDITVRCAWNFYERWIRFGICLCQDIRPDMITQSHPIRLEWMALAQASGWDVPVRVADRYYNSGFVGVGIEHRAILDFWIKALKLANSNGIPPDQFQKGSRAQTFYTVDQDALNLACMFADVPFSVIGSEGMGWNSGGFTMYHSAGQRKPWRKAFLRAAIGGYPPSNGDKHFLECAAGPILPYPPGRLKLLRFTARVAALIGRFYHRL